MIVYVMYDWKTYALSFYMSKIYVWQVKIFCSGVDFFEPYQK